MTVEAIQRATPALESHVAAFGTHAVLAELAVDPPLQVATTTVPPSAAHVTVAALVILLVQAVTT